MKDKERIDKLEQSVLDLYKTNVELTTILQHVLTGFAAMAGALERTIVAHNELVALLDANLQLGTLADQFKIKTDGKTGDDSYIQ